MGLRGSGKTLAPMYEASHGDLAWGRHKSDAKKVWREFASRSLRWFLSREHCASGMKFNTAMRPRPGSSKATLFDQKSGRSFKIEVPLGKIGGGMLLSRDSFF